MMISYFRHNLIASLGFLFLSVSLSAEPGGESGEASSKMGDFLLKGMVRKTPEGEASSPLSAEELKNLVLKPGFRKSVLKWKVLDSISPEVLKEMSSTPFMRSFLSNPEWQQAFFGSGPNPSPNAAIANLAFLCKSDPRILTNTVYRKLATATALEFARRIGKEKPAPDDQWGEKKMLERYNYFRSSHAAGLLNPMFDKLDYWDMRILAGCTHGGFGTAASLKWQRDNVRLPAQNYTGACWQAPYRLNNEWGDSIHGSDYYKSFEGLFPGATSQMTKEVGAVCGGLSHFGAYAAIANGIPAMPMGEPGHCAYTVRVDENNWVPGYSLSTERWCHWSFYGGRWSDLILMQDMFSHKENCANAFVASWAGQAAAKAGDIATAMALYEVALQLQPLNYPVWMEYLDMVQQSGKASKAKWKKISRMVMISFSKNYPEISWDILEKKVYPSLMDLLDNPDDQVKEIASFNKSLEKMLPISWNFNQSLDKQLKLLGGSDDPAGNMLDIVISSHLKSNDYGSPSMSWCLKHVEGSPELMDQFVSRVISRKGEVQGNTIAALASDMIRMAGKSGDIGTFQTAGKLMSKEFKPSLPSFEAFPGELLSSGGMVQLSSFAGQYCEPWRLWGIIESCGGSFHTENEDSAVATVIMPKIGDISGIVILGRFGQNSYRCDGMVIETSQDGTTWTKAGSVEKMQDVNRIDLKNHPVRARMVKITRPGKNFFHLNGILVYGKRAS